MDFIGFLVLIVGIAAAGFVWVKRRDRGGREPLRRRVIDVALVLGVTCLVYLLLAFVGAAKAGDEGFGLHGAEIRIGLQHELSGQSHYCEHQSGIESVYGEPEVGIEIYRWGRFRAEANYRHNSCAFGGDSGRSSDRAGVMLRYEVW